MHTWFKTTIGIEKTAEDGKIVKVSESYLVDALSHAEAENRIIEEMKPFISGDFTVKKVVRVKFSELFYNECGDKWYKAKVMFISLDEDKGIEKRTASTMLVQASDIHEALGGVVEGMKGSMADYEIASIAETDILDVYKFEAEPETPKGE